MCLNVHHLHDAGPLTPFLLLSDAAGVGAAVTLGVGNKLSRGAAKPRPPVMLTGVVRALTDGEYVISGPTYTGQRAHMGRAAVLDTGVAKIVLTERTQ